MLRLVKVESFDYLNKVVDEFYLTIGFESGEFIRNLRSKLQVIVQLRLESIYCSRIRKKGI